MQLNIMSSMWDVIFRSEKEDNELAKNDGYCDVTRKQIIIVSERDGVLEDYGYIKWHALRHEIVHALLIESGLGFAWEHPEYGHEEVIVDWIALKYDTLTDIYRQAGVQEDFFAKRDGEGANMSG